MTQPITIEDLKKVVAVSELPDEHLQWILDRSEYHEYADGEIIGKYGETADVMWFALGGKVSFYMYINGRQIHYFTFENDNLTGGVGGLMPYSRMKTYPGYSYALGPTRLLRLNKKYFAELEILNPNFIQRLIGIMTERAKVFATTQMQQEKVNALGNLAAGIAHEMNNPAAAINGISDELTRRLDRNYELTRKLLECNMNAAQLKNIKELVEQNGISEIENSKRTALQRMENEDKIDEWLEKNGITERETAETFSDYGLTIGDLEKIRSDTSLSSFTRVIPWLENLLSSQRIIRDLADASQRISHLVASIKSHVHMDQANDLQPTDIHRDIENTLMLLGFKLREKNIEVIKKYFNKLPEVAAYVGELNQVWTNLIDNAIFALSKNGKLTIETICDEKQVTVSVIDNGSGISKEIISRIFDPFFTTKKQGEGTGIGLDLVNRIVHKHNGEIKVKSEPGRTEFSVHIPIMPNKGS